MKKVCARHFPEIVTLECVVQLFQKSDTETTSDALWMCDQMRFHGYWKFANKLESLHYGGLVPRSRAWWAFALKLVGDHAEITALFTRILSCFKLREPVHDITQLVILDDTERERKLDQLKLPSLAWTGFRISKRGEPKESPDWKGSHLSLFRRAGLAWPPDERDA